MLSINLMQPDDWHLHLRDGDYLPTTVGHAARWFKRAIIMPNLQPPITTAQAARDYHGRICKAIPKGYTFDPLMTLYLTDKTTEADIKAAKASRIVYACKLYPAGVTTHSDRGVNCLKALYPIFSEMEKQGLLLLIHGEVSYPEADIFDRERLFLKEALQPLLDTFPKLRIVLEHITTQEAVAFVESGPRHLAATITAHHLWITRNDLLKGGVQPHHYCLPLPQRDEDRLALIKAATSGNPKFFIGTDSAPHSQHRKECAQGCAGIYTSHAAISLYAEVFETANALEQLEGFLSKHGPTFYGLPLNTQSIQLVKQPWSVPTSFNFGKESLIPFKAGQTLNWSVMQR